MSKSKSLLLTILFLFLTFNCEGAGWDDVKNWTPPSSQPSLRFKKLVNYNASGTAGYYVSIPYSDWQNCPAGMNMAVNLEIKSLVPTVYDDTAGTEVLDPIAAWYLRKEPDDTSSEFKIYFVAKTVNGRVIGYDGNSYVYTCRPNGTSPPLPSSPDCEDKLTVTFDITGYCY